MSTSGGRCYGLSPRFPSVAGLWSHARRPRSGWWLAYLVLTFAALASYAILYALGFPGAPSICLSQGSCWCESPTGKWALEPYNTWSNLSVYLCGFGLSWLIEPRSKAPSHYDRSFLIAFSYALWLQATGALFFHGTLTQWSRDFDASSVLMVHGIIVSSSLIRLGLLSKKVLPLAVIVSTVFAWSYRGILGLPIDPIGLTCLLTTLTIETRLLWGQPKPLLLKISLFALVLSLFVWGFTQPGRFLCEVFPGHALWHVGMGVAVGSFGLHAARQYASRPLR